MSHSLLAHGNILIKKQSGEKKQSGTFVLKSISCLVGGTKITK